MADTACIVIPFPDKPQCNQCANYLIGPRGTFCAVWVEEIIDELIAAECPEYESVE